ncbi:MAG: MFS transporter, partial [Limisphaerales bacterium]
PLDSARLDIMHPTLWGRAEAVRTVFRNLAEAVTPVAFGMLVSSLGNGSTGLRDGFMIMLIPLAIAGGISFITFRTYAPDAAAAKAYREKTLDEK